MFRDMPQNVFQYSLDFLRTFSGMFSETPRNVLPTFPGMFSKVPRNVWGHSLEGLETFLGMLGDISQNVCQQHSSEYNIPPILRVPHIPFPFLLLLLLYIAMKFL